MITIVVVWGVDIYEMLLDEMIMLRVWLEWKGNYRSICKPHWKLLDYAALGDLSTSSKGTLL